MQRGAYIRSPGKVNLHLEILEKRGDGYHNIRSLFQLIDLSDKIELSSLKEKSICRIEGMSEIPAEKNLIARAAALFREKTGISDGFRFTVEKVIPMQAGLGGGSSNAAAVLKLLNAFYRTGLKDEELAVMGSKLGSDVPFFCKAACAVVTGCGEEVEPIPGRNDLWTVLINPGISVDTGRAYALYDEYSREVIGYFSSEEMKRIYTCLPPQRWTFLNAFIPVIQEVHHEIKDVISGFYEVGADFAAMTGSGSTCFGIFSRFADAKHALEKLSGWYQQCWLAKLLDKSPDAVIQYIRHGS